MGGDGSAWRLRRGGVRPATAAPAAPRTIVDMNNPRRDTSHLRAAPISATLADTPAAMAARCAGVDCFVPTTWTTCRSQDVATLSDLGLARVCDFRGVAGARGTRRARCRACAVHALSIEPTVVQGMQSLLAAGKALTRAGDGRTDGADLPRFRAGQQPAVCRSCSPSCCTSDTPLVFHCTAGKDRTGFAAALILSALGVPRAVVMQDYLLTNDFYRQPVAASGLASQEVLDVLWKVQAGFLEAAWQVVESEHGGVDRYLEKSIGLGAAQRRRLEQLYLAELTRLAAPLPTEKTHHENRRHRRVHPSHQFEHPQRLHRLLEDDAEPGRRRHRRGARRQAGGRLRLQLQRPLRPGQPDARALPAAPAGGRSGQPARRHAATTSIRTGSGPA